MSSSRYYCIPGLSVIPMPNLRNVNEEICVSSPADVFLRCSWSSPSYYVAWYKDGVLIYSADLSVPSVLMQPADGLFVGSSYSSRVSILTILSSSIDDSGNYTCAVSCGARDVSFNDIPLKLMDYAEVSVYGEHVDMYCTPQMFFFEQFSLSFSQMITSILCVCVFMCVPPTRSSQSSC